MKNNDWKISYSPPPPPKALLDAGFSPLLSVVMALRSVTDAESAKELLFCDASCLHDPFMLTEMDKAARRITAAIEKKEKVAVYGDYDVDGITATCLVSDYLISRGLQVVPYIPDRNGEGYGLNCTALDTLRDQGVSLVISVDCGITAYEEAGHAAALGMDMIITDHHECRGDDLPVCAAVVDCKRPDDGYPVRTLAGVGVAMKLVCAVDGDFSAVVRRYSDLVAIGTVADVMPLVGENRYLVKLGLEKLNSAPRHGLSAMFRFSGMEGRTISASSIGFSLAPRLNAAGRLGKAGTALRLLMTEDVSEAGKLAEELCELNRLRQTIENDIWQQANIRLNEKIPDGPIVLAGEGWNQGVIGIAASRLAEQYSLPAIMICLTDGVGKGSCRSYGGFNLFEALSACSEYLIGFGGHALAAGLNIREEMVESFSDALGEYYRRNRPEPVPSVCCDLLITDPAMLSIENVRSLDLLEPFGSDNPKPQMCLSGAVLESMSAVGGGKHLKLRFRVGADVFDGIFFSHTAQELGLREGDKVDVAFNAQINDYHGRTSVQLMVNALRPHDGEELCRAILEEDYSVCPALRDLCPQREDFVRLWRSFDKNYRVGESFDELMSRCPMLMDRETYCICLMVFREAGLLRADNGGIYGAVPVNNGTKADLEASTFIRKLKNI